jgi:hypothetical protein
LTGDMGSPLPAIKSQEKKWSKEIRARLSSWVDAEMVPQPRCDAGRDAPGGEVVEFGWA